MASFDRGGRKRDRDGIPTKLSDSASNARACSRCAMERQVSALWAEVQEIRQALEPLRRDIRKQRRDFNRLDGELNSVRAAGLDGFGTTQICYTPAAGASMSAHTSKAARGRGPSVCPLGKTSGKRGA